MLLFCYIAQRVSFSFFALDKCYQSCPETTVAATPFQLVHTVLVQPYSTVSDTNYFTHAFNQLIPLQVYMQGLNTGFQ